MANLEEIPPQTNKPETQNIPSVPNFNNPSILPKHKIRLLPILTIIFAVLLFYLAIIYVNGSFQIDLIPPDLSKAADIRAEKGTEYVDFSRCDPWTQTVIKLQNLPKTQVHSCKSSRETLGDNTVMLTDISYGPGMNCEIGCLYKRTFSLMKPNRSFLSRITSPQTVLNGIWGQYPFNEFRNYQGIECPPFDKNSVEIKLEYWEHIYGWKIDFIKPFICSWNKYDSTSQTVIKKSTTLNGNMFVFSAGDTESWDNGRLTVSSNDPTPTEPATRKRE